MKFHHKKPSSLRFAVHRSDSAWIRLKAKGTSTGSKTLEEEILTLAYLLWQESQHNSSRGFS
jgi:hypothetical protein